MIVCSTILGFDQEKIQKEERAENYSLSENQKNGKRKSRQKIFLAKKLS